MTNIDIPDLQDCPFAKRNVEHHRGFCEFLAQSEVSLRNEMAISEAKVRELSRLAGLGIQLTPERRAERDAAQAALESGHRQIDRILAALCLTNEFMNV